MKRTASGVMFLIILTTAVLVIPESVRAPVSDTLIIGVQNDTPNLNPWDISTNTVWKHMIWRQWVFESLFGVLPNGTLYAILATNYTIDPVIPGQVRVGIKQGVTFTDGAPMNATDVVFSFQTMAFNGQQSSPIMKSIVWPNAMWPRWNASMTSWGAANPSHVGVTRFDDYSVVFHTRQNYSMFTLGTLTSPIVPAHVWMDHLVTVPVSIYVLPDGSVLSGGTEFDFDKNFGSSESDTQATIGTGPWRLVQWTRFTSVDLEVYTPYWGKGVGVNWNNRSWPFYPRNVTKMQFKIYGTLDVAVLALKAGEVHIVPWNLPIGFYNDLKGDPGMGFKIPTHDGFNYLAFNMRNEPFNDLQFRKAVSYAIDKDFIVDRLLAGFGLRGQTPISRINPAYINNSAVTPPFDLNQARMMLNTAGYLDVDLDGWRDLPDGRPMRYAILTPTKDYDPIIADTGIMIANNLKSLGLNIDSSPTAFDAVRMAAWNAMYDMYLLSWDNLGLFPELYLDSMFGCSRMVESGLGDNTPGYCGADFESLSDRFDSEMNDSTRIQAVKDAQGVLTNDLPYDTLYVERRIIGYRNDTWTGWEDVFNESFNWWSVNIIGPGQPPPPSGPETSLIVGNPNYISTFVTSFTPLDFSVIDWSGSGINRTVYRIDGGSWVQYVGSFSLAGEGYHLLEFYSEDLAGNIETTKSRTIVVDDTPPLTSIQPLPGNYTTATDFTLAASDMYCGVNRTLYRINGGAWDVYQGSFNLNPPGPYTIDYFSIDNLESIEALKSAQYTIFPAMPPITSLVIGNPNYTSTITYVRSVTPLNLSVVDSSGAGIKTTLIKTDSSPWSNYTGQFTLSGKGEHTLQWYSTDNVGNIESINSRMLRVDDSPPTTTLSVGEPNYVSTATFVTSTTPLTISASDGDGAGVSRMAIRGDGGNWENYTVLFTLTITLTTEGSYTVEWQSEDVLGNLENIVGRTFTVDNSPPTTTLSIGNPNCTAGLTYVNSSTLLTLSMIDEGDAPVGIAGTYFRVWSGGWSQWFAYISPFGLTGQDGLRYLEYYSADHLGNTEGTHNRTIMLDNTAPESMIRLAAGELTADTAFNLTATDSGSGVRLIEYRIDDGGWADYAGEFKLPEGTHTIRYRATDNLGNRGENSTQVTIKTKSDTGALLVSLWPIYLLIVVIIVVVLITLKRKKGRTEVEAPPAETDKRDDVEK